VVALVTNLGCGSSDAGSRAGDGGPDEDATGPSEKLAPADACSSDGVGGGGLCPLNFCGQVQSVASLALGQTASTGADALCTPPYACVPDGPTAGGDALQLRCVAPREAAAAFGEACVKDASPDASSGGARCRADALCIEATAAPGMPFCTTLCRSDADCPAAALCLEYRSDTLPDGSYANVGMCTPAAKLGLTACAREADCPAGQGCVPYGARTGFYVCKAGGAKSLGDACTAAADCRSGDCLDHDGHFAGTQNRAFCAGVCGKNSDCGANQRCARTVLSNNGTPDDPRDDLVVGYCRTLVVALASKACHADGDCAARADGSDTCDATTGACYRKGAAPGAPCAADSACDLGAQCVTGVRFPGGYCEAQGCAAGATTGVDACPGTASVCGQRASDEPIRVCYEGCAQPGDCSRFTAGYTCEPAQAGEASICIGGN
jgi:hypothetical protein